ELEHAKDAAVREYGRHTTTPRSPWPSNNQRRRSSPPPKRPGMRRSNPISTGSRRFPTSANRSVTLRVRASWFRRLAQKCGRARPRSRTVPAIWRDRRSRAWHGCCERLEKRRFQYEHYDDITALVGRRIRRHGAGLPCPRSHHLARVEKELPH